MSAESITVITTDAGDCELYLCPECTACVKDLVTHQNMHREQKQISEGVKALRERRNGN